MAETTQNPISGDRNLNAALSYVLGWITGIIFYMMYKDKDEYISFHALQSTVFFGGLTVLTMVLTATIVLAILTSFIGLLGLVLWVYLMYKAYSGEKYMLPVVGEWVESQL